MKIQQVGRLLLALSVCGGGLAQGSNNNHNNKEEERRGRIRGGRHGDENHDESSPPQRFSNTLTVVGEAPAVDKSALKNEDLNQLDDGYYAKPATHQDLSMAHRENIKNQAEAAEKGKRNQRVLNKEPECNEPNKVFLITCADGSPETEKKCRQELVDAGAEIMSEVAGTKFFAVCAPKEAWSLLESLEDVADGGVESDPERSLSVMPGSDGPVLRRLREDIPYGVALVRAIEFHNRYRNSANGGKGNGVRVCVIDTGLDADHPDLVGISKDGSNNPRLQTPWDEDGEGHGTHVAGTIAAAAENGIDVIGVAPDVDLYICRVFNNQGRFSARSLIDAMNDCAIAGSDIISMSLGGPGGSNAERDMVESLTSQGILLVAAAGNSGNSDNSFEFPAGYDDVMSVAAVDSDSEIAMFSSHNRGVDIAAPGVRVESLETGGGTSPKSGTSMATPHVSAVAALLKGEFPNEPMSRIRQAIENSAVDMGPCGRDNLFGHGLVDAIAAADYLNGNRRELQDTCIPVTVNTLTDDWGSETRWFIQRKASANAIPTDVVFRGGPYQNELRARYSDTFFLPSNECFEFRLTDTQNDGTCCQYGRGSHELIYNGQQLLSEDNYVRGSIIINIGCDGDNGGGNTGPVCGNGQREAGEECDLGASNSNTGACTLNCRNARCGDGFVQAGEECDEGGSNNNQGTCTRSCRRPRCGDGFVQAGEECDRGNNNDNSGQCTESCRNARCGDGFIQAGEQCDDGNTQNGDGCSSTCRNENAGGGGSPPAGSSCSAGQASAAIDLSTDNWAYFQNELYFFDTNAPDDVFLWYHPRTTLRGGLRYQGELCLDPNGCYEFYFFDSYGNGLNPGELTFSWNGQTALRINSGERGTRYRSRSVMTYWRAEVGNCN